MPNVIGIDQGQKTDFLQKQTAEKRIESIEFICRLIEKMDHVSEDKQSFYRNHIQGLASDLMVEYANDEGIEGEVMMYSPRCHGRVVRIGTVEYGRHYQYSLLTKDDRAKILYGIRDVPYIDALMRICAYSKLPDDF